MKTIEEKAEDLMEWLLTDEEEYIATIDKIMDMLKEQDRDTRHACADSITEKCDKNLPTVVVIEQAKLAVMNTKSI